MSHEFADHYELELDQTPEQVWDAIATGPGLSSWFMGAAEVDPDAGAVEIRMGAFAMRSPIVAYEPGVHFAFRGTPSPDGRFFGMEFLLEAREGGTTVLRIVSSGFLPADDWEDEYEAMRSGGRTYRDTLVEYLRHFAGRPGVALVAWAPPGDLDRHWAALTADLGITAGTAVGDAVVLHPTGLPPIDGVVDHLTPEVVGVRGAEALYRFFRGFQATGVGHHDFSGADAEASTAAWQSWLDAVAR